jgi:16S rRNA (cytosine967-C5)-methyltransferase
VGDGSKFNDTLPLADKVLCDVPCSGLGVIRRKPEIKYKNPKDFENLPKIQYSILENSAKYLKVGGELVYSTCTLNPAENDNVIDTFLKEHSNFEGVALLEALGEPFGSYKATLCPKYFNGDGFFISKIKRVK